MKKNTLLFFVFMFFTKTYGQTECPESIKQNSTTSEPTFVLSNGQNGCNTVTWPLTILIDGLTYSYVSCNGGNLDYVIDPGQTPPTGFDVTVDYGNGLLCTYDINGALVTLSNQDFEIKEKEYTIYPNPVKSEITLNINFPKKSNYNISLINILGKEVYRKSFNDKNEAELDIKELVNGIYILKIFDNENIIIKKIVIED
ncbi:T9SS type A sorting domain-containing protein [uncultured Lacinutrix sp.]|uniref:T9SS type A sorting domain-containing protein n=1 Tax=uncultured Lacinutrix sp. TaxID=574032 RepID=UPI00260C5D78|nr:T9SS type A sorting domain-containing protein [uncultured Lacinutrix sp.]